jgi:hypothetical protein
MKTLIVSFALLLSITATAQKIDIITANQQSWSGGVAGHHGTNYCVVIQCTDTTAVPDTLWVGPTIYSKIEIHPGDSAVRKYNKKLHAYTYTLLAYESYNDMKQQYFFSGKQQADDKTKQRLRHYDGAALLSYKYKGKHYSYIVKKLDVLPGLCYP